MNNAPMIKDLSGAMAKSCGAIEGLAEAIINAEPYGKQELIDAYEDMMLNELENVQHMTIVMTEFITSMASDRANEDGSVFQNGELEDDLGDKTEPTHAVRIREED